VTITDAIHSCSDTASLRVIDIDLNQDPLVAESATLLVTSTSETNPEVVVVSETGPNTSTFTGSIATAPGAPVPDGVLQTSHGDLLTATYEDVDDGTGTPAISFDTSVLDCGGPEITNLRVDTMTNARATVRFNTSEPGNTVVEWGHTPALGQTASSGVNVTSHAMTLNQFQTCGEGYFRVRSTDVHGNTTFVDNNGAPFRFRSYDIPGLYWMDDFENGSGGWTLQGEWEIGEPQGLGGSSGRSDPSSAYNNVGVLGDDLSGTGSFPGDYEPNVLESAKTPDFDGTDWTNTKVLIHKRLNVGAGDEATILLWTNGAGRPIYRSDGQAVSESSFDVLAGEIGGFADGAHSVILEFRQMSNASGQYSGWNIDDVIFKDGSLPDYAACGGCGTAPSFAGATSAFDNDACGATGASIYWKEAVSWGSGGGGTYAVYRDTTSGFTPSPSNLVASGIATTNYNDLSAPTDTALYYLVLAESDETCSAGPNNNGVLDDNTSYVLVQESTSQPLPEDVQTLLVDLVGGAHVRLEWQPTSAAVSYRIYRSTSPSGGFSVLSETGGLLHEDAGEGANLNSYYYDVVAVNACGQEALP
jgi:hypothetical protein